MQLEPCVATKTTMKVKSIIFCTIASVALCFGIAQYGSANDVASTEFSSLVAANSYANSGDMNSNVSIENQYAGYENSGEKLEFTASLGCSASCSAGCSAGCSQTCSGCCSHKCGQRY